MTDTPGRLLRLLSLLQQRADWSGPELAERLGVTTRTVRRDVDRLRALGYPVDAAPGPAGGYRLGTGAALPPLLLDDDEATAIAIALGVSAAGAVQGIEEPALAALAKLDRLLPPRLRNRVEAVRTATVPLGGAEPVDAGLLVTLARAAAEQERLVVRYVDREGRETERRVDPYRLVSTGRRWYLAALDVGRDGWRTLRVDRIAGVDRTGHRFRLVDPPDAADLVSRSTGVSPFRWQARVVLHAPPDVVRSMVPPAVGVVESHPGGALLTVGSDHLPTLAGHLVALDLDLTPLDPPELVDLLARVGRRMLAGGVSPPPEPRSPRRSPRGTRGRPAPAASEPGA
jgi:predicted DNA-binding transcriptional regulator YafY